jgi:hypothetical protein
MTPSLPCYWSVYAFVLPIAAVVAALSERAAVDGATWSHQQVLSDERNGDTLDLKGSEAPRLAPLLPPLRMTVALYSEPGHSWERMAAAAKQHPEVPMTAIISPNHDDNDAVRARVDSPCVQ